MIFGVSFDSVTDNAKFAEKYDFPFKLLSDPTRQMGVAFGAAADTSAKAAARISYLIGPDGVILRSYPQVAPAGHAAEVLADLAAAAGGS